MNIAEVNTVNYGSTGKIMLGIQRVAKEKGIQIHTYYAFGKNDSDNIFSNRIGSVFGNKISSKLAHITGMMGCFSFYSTWKLIREFKKKEIELIHLHNIHISFLNYPLFFRFIKKNNVKVVWTLHDCWTFTGHCPHFTYPNCDKWIEGCYACPRYREYPVSTFDNSKFMYLLKKKVFTGIKDMVLVTPSEWLKELTKKSFLNGYPVKVIYNGIDTKVFRPIESNYRQENNLENKFLILGVSYDWNIKKGIDVFIELSRRLSEERYQIVLVGTSSNIDAMLPDNIISIHKTSNVEELVKLYTMADLFVNPTREEVLGLVNIEANACGTPVLMFKTGGSPECINEETGIVTEVDDVDAMEIHIRKLAKANYFKENACKKHAKKFEMSYKYNEYIELYRKVLQNK